MVDVRHEQTAVFAAEATARLARSPGLAVVTAGPGVTNSVSAVTTAWLNGAPVVVLAGRAPDYRWGQGSLQEIDHPPLLAPVTKRAWTEHEAAKVAASVDEAFQIAVSPHRGPVFLDISLEAIYGQAEAELPDRQPVPVSRAGSGGRQPDRGPAPGRPAAGPGARIGRVAGRRRGRGAAGRRGAAPARGGQRAGPRGAAPRARPAGHPGQVGSAARCRPGDRRGSPARLPARVRLVRPEGRAGAGRARGRRARRGRGTRAAGRLGGRGSGRVLRRPAGRGSRRGAGTATGPRG